VMHFLFNLLKLKGLYMFQALLAHPQEALNKRHLVYFMVGFRVRVPRRHGCLSILSVVRCQVEVSASG
jgi:hypothetical protein